MPRRLLFALLLLVAAPMALLGWVSTTSLREQRDLAQQRLNGLLRARLVEIDDSLTPIFEAYARRLADPLSSNDELPTRLRELELSDRMVRKGILVGKSGVLIYPPRPSDSVPENIAMHAALLGLIGSRSEADPNDDSPTTAANERRTSGTKNSAGSLRSKQPGEPSDSVSIVGKPTWQVWYMDEGLQLVLWVPRSDGLLAGVLLERVAWIADMTAALPDASDSADSIGDAGPSGFTALVDESQQVVYRWGGDGERQDAPSVSVSLSYPLRNWRLEYYGDENLIPQESSAALFASLAGIAVVLLSLGGFVLTSVQRQIRLARSRVSFAGQVSHELRTPLTNIRLYAELARSDLNAVDEDQQRHKIAERLNVIESETQRLSRLTSGVLEMIRDDRQAPQPRMTDAVPDEVIEHALQQFAPRFSELGLDINRDLQADKVIGFDPDLLEMILVNLLSNVEKYASAGKRVDVRSRLCGSQLTVSIRDYGPGIPRLKQRSVFRAFTRLDDSIAAPSGTGIGLTIARAAARRHNGDLKLSAESPGTRFEVTISVTP